MEYRNQRLAEAAEEEAAANDVLETSSEGVESEVEEVVEAVEESMKEPLEA